MAKNKKKQPHWKQPEEKKWFKFVCDGVGIGILEDCEDTRREVDRLKDLHGITVRLAGHRAMIKHRAFTRIPWRIVRKMQESAKREGLTP